MTLDYKILSSVTGKQTRLSINEIDRIFFPELFGGRAQRVSTVERAFQVVSWVKRATSIRANAIASLPYKLYKGDTEDEAELPWENKAIRDMLWRTEASRCLWGASYWEKVGSQLRPRDVVWINPQTMQPIRDAGNRILYWEQSLNTQGPRFTKEDLVYLPLFNPNDDQGPGVAPAYTALNDATLWANLTTMAAKKFEHGAILDVVLTTDRPVPASEVERVRTLWERLYGSVVNAWRVAILRRGLTPVTIGQRMRDLAIPDLDQRTKESIAAAFEMSVTFLEGKSANRATDEQETLKFYVNTITPEATLLEEGLNTQLFRPMGLRWEWRLNEVEAIQKAEAQKARGLAGLLFQISKSLESGILTRDRAVYLTERVWSQMGMPIPDSIPDEEPEEPEPVPAQPGGNGGAPGSFEDNQVNQPPAVQRQQQILANANHRALVIDELRKWRRKALKRGNRAAFDSEVIPELLTAHIKNVLVHTESLEGIRALFDGLIEGKVDRFLPMGAGDPLPPVEEEEPTITDLDVEAAIASFDRLFPELAGILEATVQGRDQFDGSPA